MDTLAQWVATLFYKPEGRGFDFRWCHYNFSFMWWRSWLRHCATSRKVSGSIPEGVIFIDFRLHLVSNKYQYQRYFLGIKAAGA